MDRALKERIIGAVVLVLVAVLVVPVFLDGPPGEQEIISESVTLPGQSDQKSQTVVLNRDRTEPVPVTNSGSPQQHAPQPRPAPAQATRQAEPQAQDPAEQPPEEQQAAGASPASESATGMFAVQLGSFENQENAERLVAELRKQEFAAFRSKLTTSSGDLHRVRIGPQKDRESAEEMAARLEKAGYKGQVVPHP
ncbi:MAG: hypothetical protein GWN47_07795 [Woeseiaceae bacterium]|nr:hypothetical protein [Woeseiaceae bacterium]